MQNTTRKTVRPIDSECLVKIRSIQAHEYKEHKLYTKSDRTSCHRWEANQFRLFLHTGAYWLLLKLRGAAPKHSRWRSATFETVRRTFLKIAVRVRQLKSRISIALPTACPQRETLILLLGRINAQSP